MLACRRRGQLCLRIGDGVRSGWNTSDGGAFRIPFAVTWIGAGGEGTGRGAGWHITLVLLRLGGCGGRPQRLRAGAGRPYGGRAAGGG